MNESVQPPPEDLVRALEKSRVWLESSGESGETLYLAYKSLPRLDLRDAVLVEATLQETDLSEAYLDRVDAARSLANGIRLVRASLIDSIWLRSEMEGADLTQARACGASFKRAELTDACLRGCDLSGANLYRATCFRTDLTDAILADADLSTALLSGADLSRADLTGARLDGCTLDDQTCLYGARGLDRVHVSHVFTDAGRVEGEEARGLLLRLREQARATPSNGA